MKYSKEERLDIGKRIYDNEITKYETADQYGISVYCALEYMHHLPVKGHSKKVG